MQQKSPKIDSHKSGRFDATHEGRADMGEKVIINIRTSADGHRPPDRAAANML
jgi:hypothetical protein